jgi:hypothetical protein
MRPPLGAADITSGKRAAAAKEIRAFCINGLCGSATRYIGSENKRVDSAYRSDAARERTASSQRPSDSHSSMLLVVPSEIWIRIWG